MPGVKPPGPTHPKLPVKPKQNMASVHGPVAKANAPKTKCEADDQIAKDKENVKNVKDANKESIKNVKKAVEEKQKDAESAVRARKSEAENIKEEKNVV